MKILVFSDSHNQAIRIEKVLQKETNIDLIIHLGDCVSDILTMRAKFPQYKYEFVPGNCDYAYDIPEEKMLDIEGKKVFITHSSQYLTQNNLNELFRSTAKIGADVVLYGHTHISNEVTINGILYLNPGCISKPRSGKPKSYMVMNFDNGKLTSKIVALTNEIYLSNLDKAVSSM